MTDRLTILTTAGPTWEYFDSVRFISNPSSGKFGWLIAAEAARRGHESRLILGPVNLPDPPGVAVTRVTSAQEMFDVSVAAFDSCDAAVMTAAVCDYRPAVRLEQKLKKKNRVRVVRLEPTPDICAYLGRHKEKRVVIGFAMEDHDHHAHAEAKLWRKHCDAIVLNGLRNVGTDDGVIEILRAASGWSKPQEGTKQALAMTVIDLVEQLVAERNPPASSADRPPR